MNRGVIGMFDNDKTIVNMQVRFVEPLQSLIDRATTAYLCQNKGINFEPAFNIMLNGVPDKLYAKQILYDHSVFTVKGVIHLTYGDFILVAEISVHEQTVQGQFVD